MSTFKIVCLSAALLCSTSAYALEMTANNDIRNVNSGLEQRLTAVSAALQAAFNALKAQVDAFDSRITANRTDIDLIKNNGFNDEVQRWNPKLETRLDTIETNIGNAYATNVTQNNRLTTLENRPTGGSISVGTDCTEHTVGGAQTTRMIYCPDNRVATGFRQAGLAVSSKTWSGAMRCCNLVVR